MVPLTRLVKLAVAAGALAAMLGAARADEDSDHDVARDLHERGEILSYEQIARTARESVPGDIVGVALQQIGLRWTYVAPFVGSLLVGTTPDFGLFNAFLYGFAAAITSVASSFRVQGNTASLEVPMARNAYGT